MVTEDGLAELTVNKPHTAAERHAAWRGRQRETLGSLANGLDELRALTDHGLAELRYKLEGIEHALEALANVRRYPLANGESTDPPLANEPERDENGIEILPEATPVLGGPRHQWWCNQCGQGLGGQPRPNRCRHCSSADLSWAAPPPEN